MKPLLIQALNKMPVERPPVWLMRQAGRYMPQYQELRTKYPLWELFHTPELAAQITLLPIQLLEVDAGIVFSDILVLAEVFNKKIVFPEAGGPYVLPFIETVEDMMQLEVMRAKDVLYYVFDTIKIVKENLTVPLLGFAPAPFTLATYMIEGAGKTGFMQTKGFMQKHPDLFFQFLDKICDACIDYLENQIQAGVDAVQIFDSWANQLTNEEFSLFCLPFWKKIQAMLVKKNIEGIFFTRESYRFMDQIAQMGSCAISIDEHSNMAKIRNQYGERIVLQGNLCPQFLRDASRDMVIARTQELLQSVLGQSGIIMNLGHGVLPMTPVENVRVFVNTVKNYNRD